MMFLSNMTFADFTVILIWWLYFFLIGITFLPLTISFFQSFFDKGYIFSKILGLILLSYITLLLGTFHLLSFQKISLIAILIVSFFINYIFFFQHRNLFFSRKKLFLFLFEELLFFLGLAFWAYIRGHQPDIHGLEKYMDFGFVNSILRSNYFPPKDMWFTPYSINYYYFGHLMTAVLTKLSSLSSPITFNLMIASLFALTLTSAFSLGGNLFYLFSNIKISENDLHKKILKIFFFPGILSSILLTFGGNLHTVYAFFLPYQNDYPKPFWQLKFSPHSFPNSYWYPNATRFIYHTIHEFPLYSFVVSDLHGHVLDIPIVLTTIGLSLIFFTKSDNSGIDFKFLILLSFMLAVMYMTNAWDGIIYFLFISSIFFYKECQRKGNAQEQLIIKLVNLSVHVLSYVLLLFIGFFVFSLPFSLFFKPFVSGIGIMCAPQFLIKLGHIGPFLFEADHCQTSPLWQLFILYGFFYFFVTCFIFFIWKRKELLKSDVFVLLLIFLSTLLILVPEFLYVKDIYPTYYRANTMFKLVYQSFIMLSISSGYIIIRIGRSLSLQGSIKKLLHLCVFWVIGGFLLFLVLLYPNFAIPSYYGNLQKYYGLDGIKYLSVLYPSDYQAILWINKNISGRPVILEAQGDSYTDYARISANTGLPTILGWTVHEWLWRGTYDIPAPRIQEVKTLYETADAKIAEKLIIKYHIKYIFIGSLEREKYKLQGKKFSKLGRTVYKKNTTTIYKIYN